MPIDYSRYPPNWKKEIVPRILARAGNCCEFCQLRNGQRVWSLPIKVCVEGRYSVRQIWVADSGDARRIQALCANTMKLVKVVLTIAHLDHDETNHDVSDERLRALCQYCHLNYDAVEKYRRAVAGSTAPPAALPAGSDS